MVAPLRASLLNRRDRALLLLGFAAALRRSELVALRVADVRLKKRARGVSSDTSRMPSASC